MRIVLVLMLVLAARTAQAQRPSVLPEDSYGNIAGKLVRETPHFQIFAENSYTPVDLDWLQKEVEAIYPYLVERMGIRTTERFALVFRLIPPPVRSEVLRSGPKVRSSFSRMSGRAECRLWASLHTKLRTSFTFESLSLESRTSI
jgi:hypothetical protein